LSEPQPRPTPPNKPAAGKRRWLLEAALVLAVIVAVRLYRMRDLISGPFPVADVFAIDGTPVHLGAPQPELTAVHVWATWCPTCRAMEGALERASEHVRIVTIASQSGGDEAVRAYAREHDVHVPIVNDPRGELAQALGVHAFPTTLFVDTDGRVVSREVGYTTALGLRARALLARF
jgi:thiol-disulfide isomerase/thioredoxin